MEAASPRGLHAAPRERALVAVLEDRLRQPLAVGAVCAGSALLGAGAARVPASGVELLLAVPVTLAALAGPAPGIAAALAGVIGALGSTNPAGTAAPGLAAGASVARLAGLLVIVALVHLLQASRDRAAELSWSDELTRLPNRRAWQARAEFELSRMRRTRLPLTVVYLDVDDFKAINDHHGHAAGDAVLRRMGDVLRQRLRATDLGARIGGDEFALLLPDTSAEAAASFLASLREAFRGQVSGTAPPFTVSLGAATFIDPPESPATLLRVTDELMYEAKRAGAVPGAESA